MAGYCINFQWYTSYLFWCEIETIFHRHSLEKPSSSKLFNFSVLDGFVAAIFNGYPLEIVLEYYSNILNKLYWSFINNFILKSGQLNLYCKIEKLFYSLPNKKEKEERDWWVLSLISLSVYCRNNQTIEYEEYDPNRNAYIWFIR